MDPLRKLFETLKQITDIPLAVTATIFALLTTIYALLSLPNVTKLDLTIPQNLIISLLHGAAFVVLLVLSAVFTFLSIRERSQKLRNQEQNEIARLKAQVDLMMQTAEFTGLVDGLTHLRNWINDYYPLPEDRENLILWRVLPVELSEALLAHANAKQKEEAVELLKWYKEFVAEFLHNGKEDSGWWNMTIYSYMPDHGNRKEREIRRSANKATRDFILHNYFSSQVFTTDIILTPQAAGAGSPQMSLDECIIVINSSLSGRETPDEYLCALTWKLSPNGQLVHGRFATRRDVVREISDQLESCLQLAEDTEASHSWRVDGLVANKLEGARETINAFYDPVCRSSPNNPQNNSGRARTHPKKAS